jgi:hypothetical protein
MAADDDEYWNRGINMFEDNCQNLTALIDEMPSEKRGPLKALLASKVGAQFVMAPASTRRSYHNAFPSGLLMHSISVVSNARRLATALAPDRWPQWKVTFCALFHDLGKAGTADNPYYVPCEERWKRERGEYFQVSDREWMPAAELSLRTLGQFGVPMDHEEYLAIRLNDGPYEEDNRRYAFREPPLAHIIHWADLWSTIEEKEQR